MSGLVTRYKMQYGQEGAPVELARDLMRGDPDTFKRGYSAENATLAVKDLFCLTETETERVRAAISPTVAP